jgi:hypothetical protein
MTMEITFAGFESLAQIPLRLTIAQARDLEREHGEYSCTYPTGVVPGKKWLRHDGVYDDRCPPSEWVWYLCWYDDPVINKRGQEVCPIRFMRIEFVDESGALIDPPLRLP